MQSALGDLVRGKLRQINVTKRGSSPRVVRAKLIGSGGTTNVTGPTLQFHLGLRDTWMFFKKLK
jgi:stage II sporulation protein D